MILIFITTILTLFFLFPTDAFCEDLKNSSVNWNFVTMSEENLYEIYVDLDSLRTIEGKVSGVFKFYPGKEKREKEKEDFLKTAEKFREVLGHDYELPEGWEKLMEAHFEEISIYFTYEVNCNDRKIYVLNDKKTGLIKLNFIIQVKANTPAEKIYNFLCSFKKE